MTEGVRQRPMNIRNVLLKCNSWEDFKAQLQQLTGRQKGDCFEALTKHFLQLHPNYVTKLKEVWFLSEVPAQVREHLNLPGPDEGIDLIAETKDGEYWAVQCKYREDEERSLTRRELSTFIELAFVVCNNISLALVCTTADRFSYRLQRYDKLSFCAGDVWRSLDAEFFRRLHNLLEGEITTPEPLKPRPHQERAIRNAYQHFVEEGNSRGKLIMPCGTGKSLVAYWIAEKLEARTILIAVPSLALIKQTLEFWARESVAEGRDVNWICVCSDESVSEIDRYDTAVSTQDLGVRVHTDPDEISKWLLRKKDGLTVVLSTYQSGKVIAEASRNAGIVFDVGIMDEAHKTVGKVDSLFSHLLFDENISINRRIFMTATERHYRGRSDHILSMDDPEAYGDTFELLTFKEAIEYEPPILSDYRIVTIMVDQDEVAKLIEKNIFVRPETGKWDEEVEAEMLASVAALRKAMQRHPIKHTVSFHRSIARARAFKANHDIFTTEFPTYGKLETFHVSSKVPTAVRSRELDKFADAHRGLITNARCLTEGVDVPDIDCVLFADPKKGVVDIVQSVGRALRPSKDKEVAHVLVPVLVDSEETDLAAIEGKAFETVLSVLRALAANDERIVEYFRTISQGASRTPGDSPFDIDIPEGLRIDVDSFVNSIELRFWSRLVKLSWRPIEEAREFARGLGLRSKWDWKRYCNGELPHIEARPEDIPTSPNIIYKNKGWASWVDWLSTDWRPFEEAREFARSLGLRKRLDWKKYCEGGLPVKGKLPEKIPSDPNIVYKNNGWISWDNWLGTTFWRSFEEAREFARSLGLRKRLDWKKYCEGGLPVKGKLPEKIPSDPNIVYKNNGWISWDNWLGTTFWRSFEEAREFARSLGLRSAIEWVKYCAGELPEKGIRPENIPTNPQRKYKHQGWDSWGDWLSIDSRPFWRPFEEAREFARNLGLRSKSEWKRYCNGELPHIEARPEDIPANPYQVYKDKGWVNWSDWLGTKRSRSPRRRKTKVKSKAGAGGRLDRILQWDANKKKGLA
ncbi:DEAD/DEAH box helicase family protein [Nitrospinae bacterium AH_259_B05_G02_I21]|nr:DEAD/DEAH box helicase family protein [Nitrospinae bacterium AH_259_B05_G02_I21]